MPLQSRPIPTRLDASPLSLRPWHEDDAPALHEAVQESLPSMCRWLPWCRADDDLDEARKRVIYYKHS